MADPEIRRSYRHAVSCVLCRRRKIRCNRELPCNNCLKSKKNECVYAKPPSQVPTTQAPSDDHSNGSIGLPAGSLPAQTGVTFSTTESLVTSPVAKNQLSPKLGLDSECFRLKLRVRELEHQLEQSSPNYPHSPRLTMVETTSSRICGTVHVLQEVGPSGQPQGVVRGLTHKTRVLGRSHWEVHGLALIREAFETLERCFQGEDSESWVKIEMCKSLSRKIKSLRTPSWPTILATRLPSREISDWLVDCYMRNVEAIYRILHVPSFRKDYEALWTCDTSPDRSFLIQVKLVLALGAVTFDQHFSLRPLAIRWVYEAQTWVSEPRFKERLDISFVQINLLLMLAQERVGVSGDYMWISAGALLRRAILMGLHRDPSRLGPMTFFAAEMHRRLWNTILELALQSSLNSGGPVLISMDDFDTAPPGNFADEQLLVEDPLPTPADKFTQMSVALVLRNTLPQRLAVVRFLNDVAVPGSYEETLQLDKELRSAYRTHSGILRARPSQSHHIDPAPPHFDVYNVDMLMNLYLLSLHVPYFGPSLQETSYTFSRKVVVELSTRIWRSMHPSLPRAGATTGSFDENDLTRLAVCSSGFYPIAAIHAAFLLAIDIRAQLQEQESMGSIVICPDSYSVLEEAQAWCLQRVEAGETNVKGYLLMNVLAAQIYALRYGFRDNDSARLLVDAVKDVGEKCVPKLETLEAAARNWTPESVQQVDLGPPSNSMEDDCGFMTANIPPDLGFDEPMSWMFSNDLDPTVSSFW